MPRLMSVIDSGRVDLSPMATHRFSPDRLEEACRLFANQRDAVLKVALTP
jgi:alcohol dehydrogenase